MTKQTIKFFAMRRNHLWLLLWLIVNLHSGDLLAQVELKVGPTPILHGNAKGAGDITVTNGLFAVGFAVDTAPPWGVARGGIVDIALIHNGEIGLDIASLADFMPNNWSAWPSSYQRVTIEKQTPEEVIIVTRRDWGKVELESRFQIKDHDSAIHISTQMTNNGELALKDILSGYVLWPDGGFLFGLPGLTSETVALENTALADWSAAYDEHWLLGLHAPFATHMNYTGRDRYQLHTLAVGESKTFEAWVQIEPTGSLAPLLKKEISLQKLSSGKVSGNVSSNDGKPILQPAIVVLKNSLPYTWVIGNKGHYTLDLPAGDYTFYATAKGYGKAAVKKLRIVAGKTLQQNFNDVMPPSTLTLSVVGENNHQALDARINIEKGYKPLIAFFGKKTFFTELNTMGTVTTTIPPGDYEFSITAGSGFTSLAKRLALQINPGSVNSYTVEIPLLLQPQQRGWYSADMHHHSDVLDGFSHPRDVLMSQLAAGLDISFLSDHDSMINNSEMHRLSAQRGVEFISGAEFSASWAHFNAYPLDYTKKINIEVGASTVQTIFAEARRLGAEIVQVNHPYIGYGYFRSLENAQAKGDINAVPGGYDEHFDLIEITGSDNTETLAKTWGLWNQGKRAYFSAGSDVHDVWNAVSGEARCFVYINNKLNVDSFVAALKAGHSFASQGPVVFPEIVFGNEIESALGSDLILNYEVQAVSGLRKVTLIERGEEVAVQNFSGVNSLLPIRFQRSVDADTWYSLVIEDENHKFAYTNPIWVQVQQ